MTVVLKGLMPSVQFLFFLFRFQLFGQKSVLIDFSYIVYCIILLYVLCFYKSSQLLFVIDYFNF